MYIYAEEMIFLNQVDFLRRMIKENNGLILARQVREMNISDKCLSKLVKLGEIERVERGIYVLTDVLEDEMYILQVKYKQSVFSHETALYLHELTDRDPLHYSVTVKTGYGYSKIKKYGAKVYTIKGELYNLGIIEKKTVYGNIVKAYDMERTICDVVRSRSRIESSIFNSSLQTYSKSKNKNIPRLFEYAKKMGVENQVRHYMEVLL